MTDTGGASRPPLIPYIPRSYAPVRVQLLRWLARSVPCPKCGALPGKYCVKGGGQVRLQNHQARWDRYRAKTPRPGR